LTKEGKKEEKEMPPNLSHLNIRKNNANKKRGGKALVLKRKYSLLGWGNPSRRREP